MSGNVDSVEGIFFNEYLPEAVSLGLLPNPNLEMVMANFSTYMERVHNEEWDPRLDKTVYLEIAQKYLDDPRNRKE